MMPLARQVELAAGDGMTMTTEERAKTTLLCYVGLSVRAEHLAQRLPIVWTEATLASLAAVSWQTVLLAPYFSHKAARELRTALREAGLDFVGAPAGLGAHARALPGSKPKAGRWIVRHIAFDENGALIRIEHESGKPRVALPMLAIDARELRIGARVVLHVVQVDFAEEAVDE